MLLHRVGYAGFLTGWSRHSVGHAAFTGVNYVVFLTCVVISVSSCCACSVDNVALSAMSYV